MLKMYTVTRCTTRTTNNNLLKIITLKLQVSRRTLEESRNVSRY